VADRYDRQKLIILCYVGYGLSFGLLLWTALSETRSVVFIFVILVILGVMRVFNAPVSRAFLPQIVPEADLPNAIAWTSTFFQSASILGPAAGGVIYAEFRGPGAVYAAAILLNAIAIVCTGRIKAKAKPRPREPFNSKTVLAGLHYIWREKVVLGSLSL